MIKPLKSILLTIWIQIIRGFDHTYRKVTGLPTARWSMITPEIYLGGQYSPQGARRLKELGITGIVSMRTAIPPKEYQEQFHLLHLPTTDLTPPSLQDLLKGIDFISEEFKNKGKVYIHCRQGEGRGPSMVIAWLIKQGLTLDDAYNQVKKVRPFINPNKSQLARLKELESYLNSQTTQQVPNNK